MHERMTSDDLIMVQTNMVICAGRAREDRGDPVQWNELKNSIKENGLIQPLAITNSREEPGMWDLLAGGRRFEACVELKMKKVPARIYHNISERQRKIIELEENIRRKNLTWQEEVVLTEKIKNILEEEYGKKDSHAGVSDAPGISQREIAQIVGTSPASLSRELILADAMKEIPELAELGSRAEAHRALDSLQRKVNVSAEVAKLENSRAETPIEVQQKKIASSYVVMDCREGLKKVQPGTFDIVEIDPPYAISLEDLKKRDVEGIQPDLDDYVEIAPDEYIDLMKRVINYSHEALKDDGWLLLWFGSDPWFQVLLDILREAGFAVRGLPAIWKKVSGQTNQPMIYLPSVFESFFYARKGKAQINRPGRLSAFEYPVIPPQHKVHPTERPVTMMVDIISTFAPQGANLLVPFAGSGNTLLAGADLHMNGLGYDVVESYRDEFVKKVYSTKPGTYGHYTWRKR